MVPLVPLVHGIGALTIDPKTMTPIEADRFLEVNAANWTIKDEKSIELQVTDQQHSLLCWRRMQSASSQVKAKLELDKLGGSSWAGQLAGHAHRMWRWFVFERLG